MRNNFTFCHSKCDSEWDDCIEEDEKYLRENNFYDSESIQNTCPTYDPSSPGDPYPGQPPQSFPPLPDIPPYPTHAQGYGYNHNSYSASQHANRRQDNQESRQESFQSTETVCRVYQGSMGKRARCDKNIEVRDVGYEPAREIDVPPLDPCDDDEDDTGLC